MLKKQLSIHQTKDLNMAVYQRESKRIDMYLKPVAISRNKYQEQKKTQIQVY